MGIWDGGTAIRLKISAATATSSPQLKTALEDEPKYEDQENAEAAAALMEAKSVFMFGSESVESDVIAQINLLSADLGYWVRYTGREVMVCWVGTGWIPVGYRGADLCLICPT